MPTKGLDRAPALAVVVVEAHQRIQHGRHCARTRSQMPLPAADDGASPLRTHVLLLLFLALACVGCASGPTPDWLPTTITPAEQAEAECRNSPQQYRVDPAAARIA
jgi:hypothetical protein